MRQVPEKKSYLIIGDGRLAKHLSFYLTQLSLNVKNWSRKSGLPLTTLIDDKDIILLAINDDSILDFYLENSLEKYQCVHFSGKFSHKDIIGFHPLMTFSDKLYDPNFYKAVPFVGDGSDEKFNDTFPSFENPYYVISKKNKELYHSLCTLSGNGTTLLWELVSQELEKIDLPSEIIKPYLLKVCENILLNQEGRFTGPWYRNDSQTIQAHKDNLSSTNLSDLYGSFEKLSKNISSKQGAKNEKYSSDARV